MLIIDSFKQIFADFRVFGEIFSHTWFIIFPLTFYFFFKMLWMDYVQGKFARSIEYVLLEIIPPKNVEKSPQPIESLYLAMSGVVTSFNSIEELVKGMFTYSFSLELASNEGSVHLYIRTPKIFRNLVEAHLYAQYPDVIIKEVPDYVKEVPLVVPNNEWELWGTDFELVKPDPYPIKTYQKYKEDVTGKMIDPLAGLIEIIGKLGPDQKIWLQYVVTPQKESWHEGERKIIAEITGRAKPKENLLAALWADVWDVLRNVISGIFGTIELAKPAELKEQQPLELRLTPVEKEVLKAVENNLGKNMFRIKMRFLYLGRKEKFDKTFVAAFIGGIKQFNDINLNSFKPNDQSKTKAEFLMVQSRLRWRQRKIFRRYCDRDSAGKTFVLSTEELATVFHMPDMSVVSPSLSFVEAKRGSAPSNLPVE